MLTQEYDRAKALSARGADELKALNAKYDRIGNVFALPGLVALLTLFLGGPIIRRFAPSFPSVHPDLYRLGGMCCALLIAAFWIATDVLRKKRERVDLAIRLQRQAAERSGPSS